MRLTVEYKATMQERGGCKILLPHVERFSELFSDWKNFESPDEKLPEKWGPWKLRKESGVGAAMITSYCDMHRTKLDNSLRVIPDNALRDSIRGSMLPFEYDSIYFQCIDRSDGVLLCAKYNVIIGSRWISLFSHDVYDEIREKLE